MINQMTSILVTGWTSDID